MIERDKDTGELHINGKTGKFLAWLKFLVPVILTLNTIVLIPTIGYLWRHGYDHKTLTEFVETGDRVYSSTGKPVSTEQLKLEILESIGSAPRPEQQIINELFGDRLKRIEDKLDTLLARDR